MSELGDFYHIDGQPHVDFWYDEDYYDLNWENLDIYIHHKPYEQVDHLFYKEFSDEGVATHGLYMFRQTIDNFTQVAKQLIQYNYRFTKAPLPEDTDLEMWTKLNTRDLYDEK